MVKPPECYLCSDDKGIFGLKLRGAMRFVCGKCYVERKRKIEEAIETLIDGGTVEKE